ncbi:hypothetical protein CDAR_223441 [Caerostris darwini]|uniref:Uncharacterized protein n=1 Tax=Caerostris darwini TaxID=1538125 RepID=A0AAV4W8Z7_9ARAC|nr:hypothetical protein CDAR_223441 [Caerostris darwini]
MVMSIQSVERGKGSPIGCYYSGYRLKISFFFRAITKSKRQRYAHPHTFGSYLAGPQAEKRKKKTKRKKGWSRDCGARVNRTGEGFIECPHGSLGAISSVRNDSINRHCHIPTPCHCSATSASGASSDWLVVGRIAPMVNNRQVPPTPKSRGFFFPRFTHLASSLVFGIQFMWAVPAAFV